MNASPLDGLNVLLLDDEPLLRRQIAATLERLGADVTSAATVAAARQLAGEMNFDFALLDVNLPDGLGTDLLKEKVFPATTPVIVMTAQGGVAGAVEAMRLGAADYLMKPFEPAELPLVLGRARRERQSARVEEFRRDTEAKDSLFFGSALAGLEAHLQKIIAADRRVQAHLPPVLIEGETGTGKTTLARWLHHHGPRAAQPLVEVNCSALPETLAESELFGHERGAFTDAKAARMGLFEAAHGGTLFLDELPSLSPGLQAKVLKVIEDGKIRRVGGNREIAVDTRLIAATNRDLRADVAAGKFREDLLHRLDLFRIQIPPLRARGDDVVRLAGTLMERLCRRHRLAVKTITPAGERRLRAHRWPGNVRELQHELERAIVFEESAALDFAHLSPGETSPTEPAGGNILNDDFRFPSEGIRLEEVISRLIALALKQTDNNVSAAARRLGVSRDYLRYRLAGGKDKPAGSGESL
ncbi:MAG: sigma-54-dependent Fis family transcriptional regulator [Verrucomicrobia bacterium]|nr:sigma-54-dependent Fis family transcriptional regulator [Verrucomicrobiota bacterium]